MKLKSGLPSRLISQDFKAPRLLSDRTEQPGKSIYTEVGDNDMHDHIQHRSTVRRLIEEVLSDLEGDDELRLRTRPACLKLLSATELLRRSERAMNADPVKEWPQVAARCGLTQKTLGERTQNMNNPELDQEFRKTIEQYVKEAVTEYRLKHHPELVKRQFPPKVATTGPLWKN
jgi:hypothetical protein